MPAKLSKKYVLPRMLAALFMAASIPVSILMPFSQAHADDLGLRPGYFDETADERARRVRIKQLEREISSVVREASFTIANYRFPRRVEQADLNRYQETLGKISELQALSGGDDEAYYRGYADASRIREAIDIMRFQMEENPLNDSAKDRGVLKYVFSALTTGAIAQVAGELGKQTQADRSSAESIATYALQESLRQDAVTLSEKLTPMDSACMNLTSGDQITQVAGTPGHYALVANKNFTQGLNKYNSQRNAIIASYEKGVKEYCSEFDEKMGRCSTSSVSFPGGDMLATTLLSSEGDGEGPSETYVTGQNAAVDAYINRIIPTRALPEPLPMKCDTPQCKAYEDMRATALARTLASRNSLMTIAGRRTSVIDIPEAESVSPPARGLASPAEK